MLPAITFANYNQTDPSCFLKDFVPTKKFQCNGKISKIIVFE
jgi:hypothetical protein